MSQFAKMELSLLTQSCICGVDHRCALVKKTFPIQPGGVALVRSPPHSPGLPAPPTIPPCTASEWKHLKISFLLSLWSRRCLQAPHAPGGSPYPGLLSRGTASASCPRSRPARCTPAWPRLRPHLCSSRPSRFRRSLQGKQRERWLRNLRLLSPQTCQQWRRRPLAYQSQGEPVAPFSTAAAVRRGLFPPFSFSPSPDNFWGFTCLFQEYTQRYWMSYRMRPGPLQKEPGGSTSAITQTEPKCKPSSDKDNHVPVPPA